MNLDKDTIRRAMAAAGGEMGADADRLGRQLGDSMSRGMAAQVEQSAARLGKARLSEQKATDAVALAQARLTEANAKGNVEGSRLLALQQKLSQAESALALAHDNTAKAASRHSEAERLLAQDVENVGRMTGPAATRAGDDAGNRLTQGMHLAIIRNSPMIAAAAGGALAFGAPAMLAAATGLFAGIGIVAAAQSDEVKSLWTGTWDRISTVTKAQAGPMEAELEHLAGLTTARFMDMQQSITDAMSDSVPLVDRLANSVLNAADNALPGLTNAVHNAGPAIDGLGNLVESAGTGISGFFDNISQHSPAAGQAFSSLGQAIGTVLPVLGDMLGQGTELASVVLPPVASVLDVVAGALEKVAPLLPVVGGGLMAFKVVNTLTGPLDSLSGKLQDTADSGDGLASTLAGPASTAVDKVKEALPALGIAIGVATTAFAIGDKAMGDWTNALLEGGDAAAQARQRMQELRNAEDMSVGEAFSSWGNIVNRTKGLFDDGIAQLEGYSNAQDKVTQKYHEQLAAMDPVTRAQTLQKQALNDLDFALEKHGEGSASAESAQRRYKAASDAVTAAEGKEEQAIHGVTQAMIDQADQARAAIDSGFALQHAQNQQRDAEKELADAIKQHGKASVEAHDAQQNYAEAIYGTAEAAGRLAADQSGLKADSIEYKQVLDTQLLKSLLAVRDTLSGPARDAVDGFISTLQQAGVTTDGVGKKMDDLGAKNPRPTIGPATDNVTPQVDNMMNQLFDLGAAHPVPKADLDINPATMEKSKADQMLAQLGGQRPTPVAGLDPGNLPRNKDVMVGMLNQLGGMRPTPVASILDYASGPLSQIRRALDGLYNKTITVTTYNRVVSSGPSGLGGSAMWNADGAIVHMFAGGGWERMAANVAQTVKPGTLRVIGDNPQYDESYIPINKSARSRQILSQTAARMGYQLAPGPDAVSGASGGSAAPGTTVHLENLNVTIQGVWDLSDGQQVRKVGAILRDTIVKLEASAR